MKGGKRPGAGRKKGVPNRASAAREAAIAACGLTPLKYMPSTMRDERQQVALRLDVSKAAAPYVHPRLASVEQAVQVDLQGPVVYHRHVCEPWMSVFSASQLFGLIRSAARCNRTDGASGFCNPGNGAKRLREGQIAHRPGAPEIARIFARR
jgi:hypothetical protein